MVLVLVSKVARFVMVPVFPYVKQNQYFMYAQKATHLILSFKNFLFVSLDLTAEHDCSWLYA